MRLGILVFSHITSQRVRLKLNPPPMNTFIEPPFLNPGSARSAPKYEHISPVLIKLHWLSIKFRIQFKVLLLVYKALNGLAPKGAVPLTTFKVRQGANWKFAACLSCSQLFLAFRSLSHDLKKSFTCKTFVYDNIYIEVMCFLSYIDVYS